MKIFSEKSAKGRFSEKRVGEESRAKTRDETERQNPTGLVCKTRRTTYFPRSTEE